MGQAGARPEVRSISLARQLRPGSYEEDRLDAAGLLGIEDRFGSLEVGKAADLVLYDGDPFENATHVTQTIIAGRVVYDRKEYLKLPFERRALPLVGGGAGCCMGIW